MFRKKMTDFEDVLMGLRGHDIIFMNVLVCSLLLLGLVGSRASGDELFQPESTMDTLRHSIDQSAQAMIQLQNNGGWAMAYAADGSATFGEHRLREAGLITVQYPATPGMGMSLVNAYRIMEDSFYLEAAIEAGVALIDGQLACGGFRHEFYPGDGQGGSGTFDDDTTQSATRFFLELWKVSGEDRFKQAAIRCADFMLDSQYDNGGFPQMYPLRDNYSQYITLNDQAMMDVIRVLFLCAEELDEPRYEDAAMRGADCLLTLQGDPPQAGWAQQYQADGKPAPARRFEPTALSSSESVDVLRLLKEVYLKTGDKKYLKAGFSAFQWLEDSQLDNQKWARFYEYGTNQPLYCTEDGEIIFEVEHARPGYGWQGNYFDAKLKQEFEQLFQADIEKRHEILTTQKPDQDTIINRGLRVAEDLNAQHYWTRSLSGSYATFYQSEFGQEVELPQLIHTGDFVRNFNSLLNAYEECKKQAQN